jgi:sensor histidine kinase regulating citrate/malate metabolism
MSSELSALPPHLQIIAVMVIIVVSGVVAVSKYLKPFLGSVSKDNAQTDAVILAGSISDSKPVKDMIESIDELRNSIDELILCHRHARLEAQLHTEAVIRNTHAMQQDRK